MDDTYQNYVNRVAQMTLPRNYPSQLQNIQKSAKFEDGKPVSFPGCSIINPPWQDNSENDSFYTYLNSSQAQLVEKLQANSQGNLLADLPAASFHLTVADLIWENNYVNAVANNPQFEMDLCQSIAESFQQYQKEDLNKQPIQLQLLGLSIFPRAIVVCLVPKEEKAYESLMILRRCIYQNPQIISLGIEQQYDFTAHVTLGYFNEIPSDLDKSQLAQLLEELNDQNLEVEPPILTIKKAELRYFENMINYTRKPEYPVIEF